MQEEQTKPVCWNVSWFLVEVAGVFAAYGSLSATGLRVVRRVGREVVFAVECVSQDEGAAVVHVTSALLRLLLLPSIVPARRYSVKESVIAMAVMFTM